MSPGSWPSDPPGFEPPTFPELEYARQFASTDWSDQGYPGTGMEHSHVPWRTKLPVFATVTEGTHIAGLLNT